MLKGVNFIFWKYNHKKQQLFLESLNRSNITQKYYIRIGNKLCVHVR